MPAPKGNLVSVVAYDADGLPRTLLVDADDLLKVALASADWGDLLTELEEKLETADLELVSKILSSGPHGWIGNAWQRNPLPFGYSAFQGQSKSDLNLSAGSNTLYGDTVPAGEFWVFTGIAIAYVGASGTSIRIDLSDGTTTYFIYNVMAPVSGVVYNRIGDVIVPPGGRVQWLVFGATAGDDLYGHAVGYRVDIDQ